MAEGIGIHPVARPALWPMVWHICAGLIAHGVSSNIGSYPVARSPCSEASPLADKFGTFTKATSLRGLSSHIGTHPVARPALWPINLAPLPKLHRSEG